MYVWVSSNNMRCLPNVLYWFHSILCPIRYSLVHTVLLFINSDPSFRNHQILSNTVFWQQKFLTNKYDGIQYVVQGFISEVCTTWHYTETDVYDMSYVEEITVHLLSHWAKSHWALLEGRELELFTACLEMESFKGLLEGLEFELFKGLLEGLEFELLTIALLVGRELALIDRGLDT